MFGNRQLSAIEMRNMTAADAVVKAVQSRDAAEDWAKWARESPGAAGLLMELERSGNGE